MAVPVGGDKGCAGVVWRRVDDRDQRPLRQLRRRDILPGLAVVAREMNQTVVRAGPEDPFLQRRLREGEYGAVVVHAVAVNSNRATGRPHLAGVVAREVGADNLPALAFVG